MPPVIVREAALAEIHRLLDEFIDDISNFMGIPLRLFQQDILVLVFFYYYDIY